MGIASAIALPVHQVRRALREPQRLRRLHYSSVLASLRSTVEPPEERFLGGVLGIGPAEYRRLERDLAGDETFVQAIERRHARVRGRPIRLLGDVGAADHDRCHRLLYYAVRVLRPAAVVETGVFDGFSSAFILKALRDNDHGRLCSIDLPARRPERGSTDKMATDALPAGVDPGWLVPDALASRWTLRLGRSADLLPPWLAELGSIDLFFHDSLHTNANMTFELETAWRALRPGGLLLSDDVFWSRAFWTFRRRHRLHGPVFRGMGWLRKPRAEGR